MNLDDYVSNRENNQNDYAKKIMNAKRWAKTFPEIETHSLPKEMNDLIHDFSKYIRNFDFNTDLSKELCHGRYSLIQAESAGNQRIAVMIEKKEAVFTDYRPESNPPKKISPIAYFFSDFLPASYFGNPPATISEEEYNRLLIKGQGRIYGGEIFRTVTDNPISEEEYKKRISNFQLIGSQDFSALSLKSFAYDYLGSGFESDRNYYLFYSKDGHVFMDSTIAMDLKYHSSSNALGEYLASKAIEEREKKYLR